MPDWVSAAHDWIWLYGRYLTQQTKQRVLQNIKNSICNNNSEDALQQLSGFISDIGAGADFAGTFSGLAATGAAVSNGAYANADEFLANMLSEGLENVGMLGTGGMAVSAFGALANGNVSNAAYDVTDFYVYRGIIKFGAASSGNPEDLTGMALLGATYYLAGGSKGLIQAALCGE